MSEEIARGAEAVIYKDGDNIIKHRPVKSYRNPEIDARLRAQRTRKEAKVLKAIEAIGIPGPHLIESDDKEARLVMSFVPGVQLKEVFDDQPLLAKELATLLSKLHDADIVHGDLTTSNIIYTPSHHLAFIDFGLAQHTTKLEDKAVDLHLLHQSITSKHFRRADELWSIILEHYRPKNYEEVIKRLVVVERRGRNKQ